MKEQKKSELKVGLLLELQIWALPVFKRQFK